MLWQLWHFLGSIHAFLYEIYPDSVESLLCWYWQDAPSVKVLSVTVHPIDGKTARANNFPQKSKVCVFVLERLHIWGGQKVLKFIGQQEEKPLPVNRCSQKNSRWWVRLSSQKSSGAAHDCLNKSGKQNVFNEHLTSTSYVRNENAEDNKRRGMSKRFP